MTSLCCTPRCTGKLVPVNVKLIGLAGTAIVKFTCIGCTDWKLTLHSLDNVGLSKHRVVSLALHCQVAFVVAGCAYSQYCKVLKRCLAVSSLRATTYILQYATVKLLHLVVRTKHA